MYQPKNYDNLIGIQGLSEPLLKNHFTLYQGYVANFNKLNDILVAMEFENGGTLGALRVYEWNGSNYIAIPGALLTSEGCNASDTICGFNNDGPADDGGPWPNYDNHGDVITNLEQNAFTEFGVNLTALVGTTPCISSFMGHTRTSPGPRQDEPIAS